MEGFTYNKKTVSLIGVVGGGTRMKKIVEELLGMASGLSVFETITDSTDVYYVHLSWKGCTDWLFSVRNDASGNIYVEYLRKLPEGNYYGEGELIGSVVSQDSAFVDVAQYGDDLLVCMFSCTGDGSSGFWCIRVVDQFTNKAKLIGAAANAYYGKWFPTPSECFVSEGGISAVCKWEKSANGLTPNDLLCAVPVVIYTESSQLPLSGFAGGIPMLYRIYRGNTEVTHDTRMTRFAIDGHEFASLDKYICIKTK